MPEMSDLCYLRKPRVIRVCDNKTCKHIRLSLMLIQNAIAIFSNSWPTFKKEHGCVKNSNS